MRIALRFPVPFGKDGAGNFDIAPQFVSGMPAKEEAVEKGRFALRETQILQGVYGNGLWNRRHKEKRSLPKSFSASSRTYDFLPRWCHPPLTQGAGAICLGPPMQRYRLQGDSNRRRMQEGMPRLRKPGRGSLAGRTMGRLFRFGVLRGMRSVEVDPEEFRRQLANRHGLWVPHFSRMRDVPIEQLDAIAEELIRNAQRLALASGAGFGLGGMITFLPDASLLTIITLRLVQRLALLYGFESGGHDQRIEMWKAAAAAAGVDYGKDLAEKQILEKLAPRIARRFAEKLGAEAAEKWMGRLVPIASSAIGGALNYTFVRGWGRRVQRHLRARYLAAKVAPFPPPAIHMAGQRATPNRNSAV